MHVMQEFVNEVLETIEVDGIKNALVGINGLSNEQRKRLTINSRGPVELVANPSIIFMVEPTTGLDTRAAAIIVMRAVKNVAGTGRTIEAFDEMTLDLLEGIMLSYLAIKIICDHISGRSKGYGFVQFTSKTM
ncbi:pleiotropic drug resistance protein 3 [Quercus suber]|uniref:Pleiotropic drug resistance protein 3 n=1 Tax=Quercus suber TaxID=58331 RepID=A0AAW0KKZ4_QUESU